MKETCSGKGEAGRLREDADLDKARNLSTECECCVAQVDSTVLTTTTEEQYFGNNEDDDGSATQSNCGDLGDWPEWRGGRAAALA